MSEHWKTEPRDELGRWTKDGQGFYKTNTSYADILSESRAYIRLDFFGKEYPPLTREDLPKDVFGFANKTRLNTKDHIRHAREMGYKDQKVYERGAIDFWKHGAGDIYVCPARRRFYKYNVKTKQFVTVDTEGVVHTFMPMKNRDFEKTIVRENLYEI